MERIDLFDRYIAGTLPQKEISDFKKRLETDSDFASEFKVYLLTVKGICQEAEQENIELGTALKSMTKEQLKSIIGTPHKMAKTPSVFRRNIFWITSMAAMLVVVFGIGWNLYVSSQNHLCDVVCSYAYQPIEGSRSSGGEYVNLNNLNEDQIQSLLPDMKKSFEGDEVDSQDWHIDGMNLAMAYLKLHKKKDAIKVLEVLAAKSSEPQEYNRLIQQLK